MPTFSSSSAPAELARCLAAIAALVADDSIPLEERELRLRQYAAAAAGEYCPEVAFDPIAIRLLALSLPGDPTLEVADAL